MGIAENIEREMLRAGINRSDLSKLLGHESHSGVPKLLKRLREEPGAVEVRTLDRIAAALHTTRQALLEGTEPAPGEVTPALVKPNGPVALSPLDEAVSAAYVPGRHNVHDLDAVRTTLRSTAQFQHEASDLLEAARRWLDAARSLRLEGKPVNPQTLMFSLAMGKRPMAHELEREEGRALALHEEVAKPLAEKGLQPGAAREAGKRIAAKMSKLTSRE